MLHVGMNIEDKSALFTEIYRTLKPAAQFAVYDVMRQQQGELIYPVPWAADMHTSMLATADEYKQALADAGFSILREDNRRDFSLEFFKQMHKRNTAGSGPPPLGLHTLMQDTTATKIKNMIENISNNFIAPVEIITQK
jgi:dsDNA-binding SOS-regulon protein